MRLFGTSRSIWSTVSILVIAAIGFFVWQIASPSRDQGASSTFLTRADRGLSEEARQKFEEEIRNLRALVTEQEKTNARDISSILALGNAYYTVGELALAAEQYRDILSTHPNDAPALENLGQTLIEMGDYPGAEEHWIRAINISPYELTYIRLDDLIRQYLPDHRDRLKGILEHGIENLGQTYELLIRLGDWYAEEGQYDRAVSHYEVALQLSPNNPSAEEQLEAYRAKWREQQTQESSTK